MERTLLNNSVSEIDLLNNDAWSVRRKDDVRSKELAKLALQKSTDINYTAGIALAKRTLGALYIWASENEKGTQLCFEAISLFKSLNDKVNEASVYVNLGTNFYFLSDYDTSIRYYKTSLDIDSEINNKVGMASALNGIGAVYVAIEQYEKAIEPLLLSETYSVENNTTERLSSVRDSIAEAYLNLEDYAKALEYYNKCLAHAHELKSKQEEGYVLNGLGRTHAGLNEYEKALDYFNQCLQIRKDTGFKFGESATLNNIGNLFLKKNDISNAIKYLKQAFDISTQIGSKEGIYQSSEKLANLYELENNANEALRYHKIFHQAKEDVRNHKSAQLSKSFELQNKVLQSQAERSVLEERAKELENYSDNLVLMSEIGQKIISQLTVGDIIETVYENFNTLMDASVLGIGIYHEESEDLFFPSSIEKGDKLPAHTYLLSKTDMPAVKCFLSQKDYWTNNFSEELLKAGVLTHNPVVGENTESIIYVPITYNGKKLGVLTIQSFSINAYTEYHLQVVKNLAVYVAIALENANLYSNLEERVLERTGEIKTAYQNNKLLSELGQQITSALSFEDIFSKLHSCVSGLMDAGSFGVRLYNPKTNVIEYKYGIEKGIREGYVEVSMNDTDNFSVWCVSNRKEIFINDNEKEYKKYTNQIRVVMGDMPHSLIFYPIMLGEKVLGCITVQSYSRNAYTDYHLDILKTLATYTAIALENANLFEVMEEKVKERTLEVVKQKEEVEKTYQNTKLLSKIGNDITSILSLEDIVQNVYSSVNNLMDAAGFGIGVYNEANHRIEFPLYIEGDLKFNTVSYSADEPDKLAAICFNNKKDIVINDFKNEIEQYVGYVQAPLQGKVVESIIYLPLILKEKKLGVITVQSFSKQAYSEYHVEMLRNLAVYVGIAIDNASLYTGLEERVKERTKEIDTAYQNNRLLSEIGQQITSTLNFEDIFERLHKYVIQLMDAEIFSIRIYHAHNDTIEYKFEIEKGVRDHEVIFLPASDEENYSAWCIKNKKEIMINDHAIEYKKYVNTVKVIAGDMPESLLFHPIMIGERVLGVITIQSFKKHAYTNYHLDILKNLASYTAIAFDNASLYETMEEKVNDRTKEVVTQKEEIEKTYENTRILSQIGKDISTTFSIQEIITKVYENLNTLMDASCFGIGIYREKSNEIVFPSTIERKKHLMPYTYNLKDIDRPAVWCYTTQSDYMINHFSEEFVKSNKVQDYQAKEGDNPESIIYVPITQNDKKIGVITVQSFKANAYKDYHLQILKSLAVYVAIAIDNASLYNNLEDRVRERTEEIEKNYEDTRLLGQIAEDISSSLSVETIISKVYQNVNKIIRADCFGIGIYNAHKNELEFKGFVENDQKVDDFVFPANDPNRLASMCFTDKKDILINDYTIEYINYIKGIQTPISGKDSLSIIYLPIYSKEKVMGVITVQSYQKNAYTNYHFNILKGIAVSVGIGLDNAYLYQNLEEKINERTKEIVKQKEEIEKANDNTRLLSQIGKDITSTLSIREIIEKVYSNVNNLMDAAGFGIGVFKEENEEILFPLFIEGDSKYDNIKFDTKAKDKLASICFNQKRDIVINDFKNEIEQYVGYVQAPLEGKVVESIIYLPLTLKEKVLGVITVQSFNKHSYNEYHVDILRNLAVYVAIAIDNASLYENMEHRVIERTQEVTLQKEQLEKNFNDTN